MAKRTKRGSVMLGASLPPDPDVLLAPVQVTAVMGATRKTLERWRVKGGYIPFVKIGSLVRYRAGDVRDYIRRTHDSTSE